MNITETREGSKLTVALEGRLETTTAPDFEEVIKTKLDGVTELVIDLSQIEYVSSAGLRVILSAQKKMNIQGSMKVTGVNEIIGEIFDVTGFSEILTIE